MSDASKFGADERVTPMRCRREAELYSEQANSASQAGTRIALLRIAHMWHDIADQIENLEIVRQINTPPRQNARAEK